MGTCQEPGSCSLPETLLIAPVPLIASVVGSRVDPLERKERNYRSWPNIFFSNVMFSGHRIKGVA